MFDSINATETLPPLYEPWVRELLSGGPPREARATCSNCAMCERPNQTPYDRTQEFVPSVKCCSFVPDLPNFLVGGVLSDEDPAAAIGRKAMEKRLAKKLAVSPLGVAAPPIHSRASTTTAATPSAASAARRLCAVPIWCPTAAAAASGGIATRSAPPGSAST